MEHHRHVRITPTSGWPLLIAALALGAGQAGAVEPPPASGEDAGRAPGPRGDEGPAVRRIASWEQALAELRSHSTFLHVAEQQVEGARGEHLSAWGATLPTLAGAVDFTRT